MSLQFVDDDCTCASDHRFEPRLIEWRGRVVRVSDRVGRPLEGVPIEVRTGDEEVLDSGTSEPEDAERPANHVVNGPFRTTRTNSQGVALVELPKCGEAKARIMNLDEAGFPDETLKSYGLPLDFDIDCDAPLSEIVNVRLGAETDQEGKQSEPSDPIPLSILLKNIHLDPETNKITVDTEYGLATLPADASVEIGEDAITVSSGGITISIPRSDSNLGAPPGEGIDATGDGAEGNE